jgi:uncharacterized protein (TIGR00255 family)
MVAEAASGAHLSIRSMTGYAQVRGTAPAAAGAAAINFIISLKSVNHRFLDLHLRLPANTDALEMKLRRLLKEKLARGHVEVTLSLEVAAGQAIAVNRELVGGYIRAFRQAAQEFGITGEPDLNAVLRIPGALSGADHALDGTLEGAVLAKIEEAIRQLNAMREEEGRGIERELRDRMQSLRAATAEVEKLRGVVLRANLDRIQTKIRELVGASAESDRILQEAALAADRSDIQEELVRMSTHIDHFLGLLSGGGETGKKLDFLLQEMNREANTLLSKTSGLAGEALRITEMGLRMKSEIEKLREQVQNLE